LSVERQVLIIGGAGTGKTTLLLQLYGRVSEGDSALTLRSAVDSLAAISDGMKRLHGGLPVRHTPQGTDAALTLPLVDASGREFDVTVPDYAGEDLRRVGDSLRLPDRWRNLASSSNHWIVLVRLTQHPDIPDLIGRPVGELASAGWDPVAGSDPQTLPIDMLTVELLQLLRHSRKRSNPEDELRVTLTLSCWDELELTEGTSPRGVAAERLALLDSYCSMTFGSAYRVVGVSSQGRALRDGEPDEEFIDEGPESMGWLIDADGYREPDLTKLIATA
jgi:hypothetical protein